MKAGWESEVSMPGLMWPQLRHPREVAAMVEEQARRWTLRQYGRWEPVDGTWPVVTISREPGNQSHALGCSLAERLGFSYWDRAVVVELVRLLGVGGTAISTVGEGTQNAIKDFLGDSVPDPRVISTDYVDRVRLVIDSIVCRGGAVIVGQGAQFLVAPRAALRVRLVVPMDLNHAFGGALGDPADFDVVVNAGTYERERAVGLVLMAYLAKFGDWPTTARGLLNGRRTGLVPLLPRAVSGLMDERRVQHKRDLTSVVRT